jgi:hypothetical protein
MSWFVPGLMVQISTEFKSCFTAKKNEQSLFLHRKPVKLASVSFSQRTSIFFLETVLTSWYFVNEA